MKLHLEEFPTIPVETWKQQIAKELKIENTPENFLYSNKIEGLTLSLLPENYPTIEINNDKKVGDWEIGYSIIVESGKWKDANEEALQALNFGANSLTFELKTDEKINLETVLKEIAIEYIDLHFNNLTKTQSEQISQFKKEHKHKKIVINNDENGTVFISSYALHNCGGNAQQEIAYILSELNQAVTKQSISSLHLELGIGSNVLIEIAKFKTVRILINQLLGQYDLQPTIYLSAKTGFINKSCKDPHTNLLRQTTEAFSAIIGNVDQLIVVPYDNLFIQKDTLFTSRMGINISNLLKEEGKLQLAHNSFEGAKYINQYIHLIGDASWNLFNQLENEGGITSNSGKELFEEIVLKTKNERIQSFKNKESIFIGINSFENPTTINNQWNTDIFETFLSIPQLILELA
jgi:methylmalonyl-CoA mutase